ncbi:MAG: hypothetical protein WC758_04645 [Candidatus Woesearchaeota archaeon]|jgi:hypothetical protein
MREQKLAARLFTYIVFGVVILVTFVSIVGFVSSYNYEYVNVSTRVNVTNAFPEVLNVTVGVPAPTNITLNAGSTRTIYCNATIRDWNGYNDLTNVNATFYYFLNQSSEVDDGNVHYTNTSCSESINDGQYLANYSCALDIKYFAYNGTWYCNVTAIDNKNFTGSLNASTKINPLYALNVTDVIDYGNLSVTDYSENITAAITNYGNMNINVSVLGYGLTQGDGLGFVCQLGTNISVQYQRFASTAQPWSSKIPLAATNKDMGATLLKQTDDLTPVTLDTYWQLYVPPNPFGLCTGTVRFTATA